MNNKTPRAKTHCEKYGHAWASSMVDGWERCSHIDIRGRRCSAVRRRAAGVLPVAPPASTPAVVTEQAGGWEELS
jgi:hypothetical protein